MQIRNITFERLMILQMNASANTESERIHS